MIKKLLASLAALFFATAFAAVDVNKADQAALESVKGIGPALSTRIIDQRKKSEFKDWSDLINRVRGIGDHNAVKLSAEGLTVNDATYTPAPATAKKPSYTPTGQKGDKTGAPAADAGGTDAPPSVQAAGKAGMTKSDVSTAPKVPDQATEAKSNPEQEAKTKAKLDAKAQARAARKAAKAASAN